MRMTEGQLRRIVHEEARKILKEMPYAGSKSTVYGDDPEGMTGPSSLNLDEPTKSSAVDYYMQTPSWKEKAKRLYGNFPYPVWVIPFVGGEVDAKLSDIQSGFGHSPFGSRRSQLLPLAQQLKFLEKAGVDVSDIGVDDFVILALSTSVSKNAWPSPWMVFHALFDGSADTYGISLEEIFEEIDEEGPLSGVDPNEVLTMGSARNSTLDSEWYSNGDMQAELMCQALLTKGGIKFNTEGLEREQMLILNNLKKKCEKAARGVIYRSEGKLLVVSVS
jgi:hypothetical protein